MVYGDRFTEEVVQALKQNQHWEEKPFLSLTLLSDPRREWIALVSPAVKANFRSLRSFSEWFARQSDQTFIGTSSEQDIPDEKAFQASLFFNNPAPIAKSKQFIIHYDAREQVGAWDVIDYRVTAAGVSVTWNDFFDQDEPGASETVSTYSHNEYALMLLNPDHPLVQYMTAEGLLRQDTQVIASRAAKAKALGLTLPGSSGVVLKSTFEELLAPYTTKDECTRYWNELRKNYSEKGRHYHDLNHLRKLVASLLPFKEQVEDWEVMLFAVFYHDIVYDVSRHDNEQQSADWAGRVMSNLKLEQGRIARAIRHVLATKDHASQSDPDTNLFTDADLGILGSNWGTYENYGKQIRQEYAIYDDPTYTSGRRKVLEKFLEKEVIFKTKSFFLLYEEQARANMARELEILRQPPPLV